MADTPENIAGARYEEIPATIVFHPEWERFHGILSGDVRGATKDILLPGRQMTQAELDDEEMQRKDPRYTRLAGPEELPQH